MRLVPLALASVAFVLAAAPVASSAVVHSCPGLDRAETAAGCVGNVSVRNISCRHASVLLQTAAYYDAGGMHVRGWRCATIGSYSDGGIFRCARGGAAIRFSAGG
jgi:hypothetical protein